MRPEGGRYSCDVRDVSLGRGRRHGEFLVPDEVVRGKETGPGAGQQWPANRPPAGSRGWQRR